MQVPLQRHVAAAEVVDLVDDWRARRFGDVEAILDDLLARARTTSQKPDDEDRPRASAKHR
ncbi:MAG TPA: hypothetical protein VK989_06540 [Polyangia bacterium]|nr:hypothetical protein [Polyangia bacterium]